MTAIIINDDNGLMLSVKAMAAAHKEKNQRKIIPLEIKSAFARH